MAPPSERTETAAAAAAPPAAAGEDPAGGGIRKAALRGSIWMMGGYGASQLLRLGGNLILTRLLFPEVFGLMSLMTSILVGLTMFSDLGIGPAIVQRAEGDDPRFVRTAWTMQVLRGIALGLAAAALAKPLALFYDEPRLLWAMPFVALTPFLLGFDSTGIYTLQRRLRWERVTLFTLACDAIGIAATVGLAAFHRSTHGANDPSALWVVIGGSLVGTAIRVPLGHLVLSDFRHRFLLDREHARSLLHFARWIFLSTLLTFLVAQSDRLIFAKLIPFEVLGVYGIAAALGQLPTEAVQRLGNSVLFPALSRVSGRGDFAGVFARARLPLVLGGATIVSGIVASGPLLIDLLYDRRYAGAGWMLQILAASAWFQILEATNSSAILATGRTRALAANRAAKLAGMLVLVPLGFRMAGFGGALAGLAASDVLKYAASVAGLRERRLATVAGDAAFTAGVLAVAALGILAARALAAQTPSRLLAFLVAGTTVCVIWGAGFLAVWRSRKARAGVPAAA